MEPSTRRALERDMIKQQQRLLAFAMSLCKNHALAEDLVQDTCVKAIMYLESFEQGTNMYAWMCTILKNQYWTHKRRAWRNVEDPEGLMVANLSTEAEQMHGIEAREAEAHSKVLLKAIRRILKRLPETQRNAFWLVHAEDHTYEEVASIQDCPLGTVKSRVSRALHAIIKKVKSEGLNAEGITADHWSAAFAGLSMKVIAPARPLRGSRDRPDFSFYGMSFHLVETVRLGNGPVTQVFAIQ